MTDHCRSCHQPIIWAITTRDKLMPVDLEPVDGGNIELVDRPGVAPLAILHAQPPLDDGPLHRSHFASCPSAEDWRR